MAKFCSECGHPLDDNMRFCENCGAPCAAAPAPSDPAQPEYQPAQPEQPEYQPEPVQPEVPYAQPVLHQQPAPQPEARPTSQPVPQPAPGQPGTPYAQAPQPIPQPQQTPAYPYATPVNAGRQAGYASAPNAPGDSDKKSHLGIGIAVAVIAVLLIAAVIVVFFVWKPFDKKDDGGDSSTPAATTSGETVPDGDVATDAAPTQPAPTEAPTSAPTQAPSPSDDLTVADRMQIERALSEIVSLGYSRTEADIDRYLGKTFEYNYADAETRKAMYDAIKDDFYQDIDTFKETYGDDYELTVSVSDVEVYSGEELSDALNYYAEDCDISSVEMIAQAKGSVTITGSLKSETRDVDWEFIKADGEWYPAV